MVAAETVGFGMEWIVTVRECQGGKLGRTTVLKIFKNITLFEKIATKFKRNGFLLCSLSVSDGLIVISNIGLSLLI